MPLYDFQCAQCRQVSEMLVRSDAQPACPHCGHPEQTRLVSKPAAPGGAKALVESARARARAEGHFSNY
jgi:putative FmdB family regulatory protein